MGNHERSGILYQIYVLAVLGLIVVGLATYFSQHKISEEGVKDQMEQFMNDIAVETINCVKEYPSYKWLIQYWYENADELDLEYDVDFRKGTETEKKCRKLARRHPELQLKYADVEEIEALPAKDQKLYAEIVYSWMTTRCDQIKQSYQMDFLFCLVTDTDKAKHPYQTQFFLLSGADPGESRGTKYEQVYPLGKVSSIAENKSMQNAMRMAVQNAETGVGAGKVSGYMADAGQYVDYYAYVDSFDDKAVLIGITEDLTALMKDIHNQTVQGTSFAVMYEILLLAIILLMIFFTLLRALKRVMANIRLYAETKDKETVNKNLSLNTVGVAGFFTKRNEVGQLSNDVMKLAEEIENYVTRIEEITAEKQRIDTELDLAARIQRNMLQTEFPAFPDHSEFDVYAMMTPAREVGGDFYDFFMIDDDHLAITIADVSGKGIPAALFMMVSKFMVRNEARNVYSPARTLEMLNEEFCENNEEDMFITIWLGVLELSTGKLTAANAGHEYPAYKSAEGNFEIVKDKHGFILGGMSGLTYEDYEIQMEPGAKFFTYTDGLTEASDAERNMFGMERMIDTLRESENGSVDEILEHVDGAVRKFIGKAEQFDDLTMICLEYRGADLTQPILPEKIPAENADTNNEQ